MSKKRKKAVVPVVPRTQAEEDIIRLAAIRDQHGQIVKLRKVLTACEVKYGYDREPNQRQAHNEAKAAVEHAQENLDGAVMVLVDLCGDEDLPLQKAAKDEKAQGRPGDEESWRKTSLKTLGGKPELSAGDAEKLAQAGIHTIGDLAEWEVAHPNHVGLKGLGPAAWGRIADAMAGFWGRRQVTPEAAPTVSADQPPAPPAAGL